MGLRLQDNNGAQGHALNNDLSDVVEASFLQQVTSEGVRKAADYKGNNLVYRSLLEHNFKIGYTAFEGAIGPRITLDW